MIQALTSILISLFILGTAHAKNELKKSTPEGGEIQVTQNDVKIIHRASEILSKPSVWNKKDNRECPTKAKKFSLYCALYNASVEVNGEFDHRLAALEEVRRTVEEFSKNKNYEHRLMDYNNDPTTSFNNIKKIFETTEKRLKAVLQK